MMFDWSTTGQAAVILFREGLEALLVIAALAAFLRRVDAAAFLRPLYGGAVAAIVASFGMAWVFAAFFDGVHNDLIEAGVMLAAAALMFYMTGWLVIRQDPRAWQAELKQAAERAIDSGTALSLAGLAFMAVFREGGETVLFLYALASSSGGWSPGLFAGLVAAAVALAGIYAAMQWLALRLPLRPMFLVTSAFLFAMGLKMVGEAVQELQEQALLPIHTDGVPAFVYGLGLNGSWEALGAQLAIVLAALAGLKPLLGRARARADRAMAQAALPAAAE